MHTEWGVKGVEKLEMETTIYVKGILRESEKGQNET